MYVQACRSQISSDSRYAYSLHLPFFKARPVMTIFVFENTNNGTLRSILNVGYVVGIGRRERQALLCSGCTVELQLVWPKISRSRA
jgi:hypothetical protein